MNNLEKNWQKLQKSKEKSEKEKEGENRTNP